MLIRECRLTSQVAGARLVNAGSDASDHLVVIQPGTSFAAGPDQILFAMRDLQLTRVVRLNVDEGSQPSGTNGDPRPTFSRSDIWLEEVTGGELRQLAMIPPGDYAGPP